MTNSTRIPRTISEFNDYIENTDDHLQSTRAGGQVYDILGISTPQADEWSNRREYWEDTLYPKYRSKDTHTPTVTLEVQNFMKNFREFGNPLLNLMAASFNANEKDAVILNFALGRKAPTKPESPIAEKSFTSLKILGGSEIKAASKTDHDASRASVAEHADGVQYAYVVANDPPANVDDGTVKEFYSGSTHTFNLGVENLGKRFYVYTRWYNSKYPEFAGPWSNLYQVIIA
jgi:hypothetical protein